MHPVIRIICFLVFVVCLSRANAGQLFLATGLLFLLHFYSPVDFLQPAFPMLVRLRWFFLSILVLYIWMTPDTSLFTDSSTALLSIPSGMASGLGRIFSLLLIVFAISYLLSSLEQSQLVAAIYWLVTPLVYVGLEREKMVLRLAMGMEAAGKLMKTPRVKAENEDSPGGGKIFYSSFYRQFYQRVIGSLQHYYQYVLRCAEEDAGREVSFDCLNPPRLWQWGFPLGLYILFVLAGRIN